MILNLTSDQEAEPAKAAPSKTYQQRRHTSAKKRKQADQDSRPKIRRKVAGGQAAPGEKDDKVAENAQTTETVNDVRGDGSKPGKKNLGKHKSPWRRRVNIEDEEDEEEVAPREDVVEQEVSEGEMGERKNHFKSLGLCDKLVSILANPGSSSGFGFSAPTSVQKDAIPRILEGRDVLIKSQTGSGKTLTFCLPILELLQRNGNRISRTDGICALILSPTRELCFQISQVLEKVGRAFHWVVIGSLVGGEKRKSEKARLRKGINILVATPGRLLDHVEHTQALSDSLKRRQLRWLVLDEADRLTDSGFVKQIGSVLDWLEKLRDEAEDGSPRVQTILCSATLNGGVKDLAKRSLNDPVTVEVASVLEQERKKEAGADETSEKTISMPTTLSQHHMIVDRKERLVALTGFILRQVKRYRHTVKIIIFVSCRAVVEFLYAVMNRIEWPPSSSTTKNKDNSNIGLGTKWWKLHGNIEQQQRRRTVSDFSKTKGGVLICTDVAARGLDLPCVDWIVQYDPPSELTEYVHRVGRTARSGRRGSALLFLDSSEQAYIPLVLARGVQLVEMKINSIYAALLKSAVQQSKKDAEESGAKPEKGIASRALVDPLACGALLQARFQDIVQDVKGIYKNKGKPNRMKILAEEAFMAYVRAYAVHSKETKTIFHPKKLHLGHVAHSFGLLEQPKGISAFSKTRRQTRTKEKIEKKRGELFTRNAKKVNKVSYSEFSK
mmetsp:Transcript_19880/g.32700  ORF Transcript_19880/g.32700 Transcript_19880/m.32700 type:complete len:725 (+) Transcript_19880:38-2212(+)